MSGPDRPAGLELERLFPGDSEMAVRMRAFDWSATPLGPVASWSLALRTMVRLLLANRLPMLLWWGPHYVSLYNDPYRPVLGNKHPWALGQPVRECWKEIWHVLQPLIDTPFRGGPATWDEALELIATRFTEIVESAGPEAILNTHYTGTLGQMAYCFGMRFVNRLGATGLLLAAIHELPAPADDLLIQGEQLARFIFNQQRPDGSLSLCDDPSVPAERTTTSAFTNSVGALKSSRPVLSGWKCTIHLPSSPFSTYRTEHCVKTSAPWLNASGI